MRDRAFLAALRADQKKRGAVGEGSVNPRRPGGPRPEPGEVRGASLERQPRRTVPVGVHLLCDLDIRGWRLAGVTKKLTFLPMSS